MKVKKPSMPVDIVGYVGAESRLHISNYVDY